MPNCGPKGKKGNDTSGPFSPSSVTSRGTSVLSDVTLSTFSLAHALVLVAIGLPSRAQISIGFWEMRWRLLKIIAIPMILHGLYDTALKKQMGVPALFIALFSGWIVLQEEQMLRLEAQTRAAMAAA